MAYKKTCVECGQEFFSRSACIICERCINITMYGYDPRANLDEPHTSHYADKTFKQLNKKLLEECHMADACGKSYGYYKADIRTVKRYGKQQVQSKET